MSDQQQKIRERAYALWEARGRPAGEEQEHWDLAQRELDDEEQSRPAPEAGAAKAPARKSTGARSVKPGSAKLASVKPTAKKKAAAKTTGRTAKS